MEKIAKEVIKITKEQREFLDVMKHMNIEKYNYWRDFRTESYSCALQKLLMLVDQRKLTPKDREKLTSIIGVKNAY